MTAREFRFGLQVDTAASRPDWQEQARRAEAAGFSTILVPDHVMPDVLSPIAALDAMASATDRLRVGTFVLNNDLRHPALLARDAATIDLLTDGRLELGIGAGHAAPEYEEIGIPFDPAPVRVSRLEESVRILRALFDGDSVTHAGEHYSLRNHTLFPARRPSLLVGGNGDRVMAVAARYADIVGFTGLGRTLADGQHHETDWTEAQIDRKVDIVRAAAGDRIDTVELNALVQHVQITDDRVGVLDGIASSAGGKVESIRDAPYLLIGTVDEIVQQLRAARDRWGFTYFVTRRLKATAAVIAAL